MRARRTSAFTVVSMLACSWAGLVACDGPVSAGQPAVATGEDEEGTVQPAGSTCAGVTDCPRDQACVAGICRYRRTSTSGEILAAAAKAQVDAGDVGGAVRTYAQAIQAFRDAEAPVPPDLACGAAAAALRVANDPASRETAASYADTCFRSSLPGDATRVEVERVLARLRFDGLDVALFDRERPAERFFTKQQSRPTTDAIEIAIDLPDGDQTGYGTLSESLRSEPARTAIAECFVADWELHHQRSVEASLMMKFDTTMRDMGDYDVFQSNPEVTAVGDATEGFAPCVAEKLHEAVQPGPRMPYPVRAWQAPFAVAARLQ